MTNIMQLSEKMAEGFARSITGQFSTKNDWNISDYFKAGFQCCLDLLAKQSGKYEKHLIQKGSFCPVIVKKDIPEWENRAVEFVDIAALLSANAKIAKLEEETKSLHNSWNGAMAEVERLKTNVTALEKQKLELQQRVKDLEGHLNPPDPAPKFNTNHICPECGNDDTLVDKSGECPVYECECGQMWKEPKEDE